MKIVNHLEVDISKKLEISISNTKPVALADLTISLFSFNQQYQKFIESECNQAAATELFIKEVRTGSIVVELVSHAIPCLPLFWEGWTLTEWLKQAKDIFDWLLGKIDTPPKELSKLDLQQWNSIVEPIAKDNGCQMNISASDNGTVINQFFFNSTEANAAQNKIRRLIDERETPNDHIQTKKVMTWYQTKFDSQSDTGDKAFIEDISKNAVKVIFDNASEKELMLAGDNRFSKPWHKLAYVVDVATQTIGGVPKMYTILKYYPEDTFDPEE